MAFSIQKSSASLSDVNSLGGLAVTQNNIQTSITSFDKPIEFDSNYLQMDTSIGYPATVNIPQSGTSNYAETVYEENNANGVTDLLYVNDPQNITNSGSVKVKSSLVCNYEFLLNFFSCVIEI